MKRRIKRLQITKGFIEAVFGDRESFKVVNGLPPGTVCIGMCHDESRGLISCYVQHESFAEIEDGEVVPLCHPPTFVRLAPPPGVPHGAA